MKVILKHLLASTALVIGISVVLSLGVWYGSNPYNSHSPGTQRITRAFVELKTAWDNGDTNSVLKLCSRSFDPYSTNNYATMAFNMAFQSKVGKTALHPVRRNPSTFIFQPNASRNWYSLLTAPQYLLGMVYFYTKEGDQWKFTGQTDFHVD
jgi:hypothetical protein